MTLNRFIAATTVTAFTALFFFGPGRDAWSSGFPMTTTGPPGLVVNTEKQGWFELRGTPVSVDNQPVKDWGEVNAALQQSGYTVMRELQGAMRDEQHEQLPASLDGGVFTITIRNAAIDGRTMEHRFTVRRWFPKRNLFARSHPTQNQRFEMQHDNLQLN